MATARGFRPEVGAALEARTIPSLGLHAPAAHVAEVVRAAKSPVHRVASPSPVSAARQIIDVIDAGLASFTADYRHAQALYVASLPPLVPTTQIPLSTPQDNSSGLLQTYIQARANLLVHQLVQSIDQIRYTLPHSIHSQFPIPTYIRTRVLGPDPVNDLVAGLDSVALPTSDGSSLSIYDLATTDIIESVQIKLANGVKNFFRGIDVNPAPPPYYDTSRTANGTSTTGGIIPAA